MAVEILKAFADATHEEKMALEAEVMQDLGPEGVPEHFRKGAEKFRSLVSDPSWFEGHKGLYVLAKGKEDGDWLLAEDWYAALLHARDVWKIKAPFVARVSRLVRDAVDPDPSPNDDPSPLSGAAAMPVPQEPEILVLKAV